MLSSTQSKKNLFKKTETTRLSPSNKAPMVRRTSLKTTFNNVGDNTTEMVAKKVYGMGSNETPVLFQSNVVSPIATYLNQLNNDHKLSNS